MANEKQTAPDDGKTWCPECRQRKPVAEDDLHDVVVMRMDWRKAGRPERTKIDIPIGESPMCLQCYVRIMNEWSPKAPWFDDKGDRLPALAG